MKAQENEALYQSEGLDREAAGSRVADDLMEMSRITRGTFELRRERVSLEAALRSAIETADRVIGVAEGVKRENWER